jgi:hypothetical protein
MPAAAFLRIQAEDARRRGDDAGALRFFQEASAALVAGQRDTRAPWAVFRHSADAHAYDKSDHIAQERRRGAHQERTTRMRPNLCARLPFFFFSFRYACRLQKMVRGRIQQRITGSIKIAAAFRGYNVRYQQVLRSRRLTAAQRKVARPYRGRLAMLLPMRVKCQKVARGFAGRLVARHRRAWFANLVRVQARARARTAR